MATLGRWFDSARRWWGNLRAPAATTRRRPAKVVPYLHPPAPRRSARIRVRDARFRRRRVLASWRPRPAGVVLVAVSLVGGLFAYRLYESGQPGNPEVSPGGRLQSGVAVYVAPGMSDGIVQDAQFGVETYGYSVRLARRPAADVYLVVGFYGDAWPRDSASPSSLDGAEVLSTFRDEYGSYVAVRLSAAAGPLGVSFGGALARPVQASQNGRVAVEPPVLWPATPCAELARGDPVPDLARTVIPCDTEAQFYYRASIHHAEDAQAIQNQEQRVELSDLAPSSFRVDYVSPPLALPDFFTWSATGGLSVTARLVDIEGEARAQRDLFAAGVLAGLASALLLFALERSVRRVGRPNSPAEHDRATPPSGRLRRRRVPRRATGRAGARRS